MRALKRISYSRTEGNKTREFPISAFNLGKQYNQRDVVIIIFCLVLFLFVLTFFGGGSLEMWGKKDAR